VFELPFSNYYYSSGSMMAIGKALSLAPALKTVVSPAMRLYGLQQPPEHLTLIATNPSLQCIELRQLPAHRFGAFGADLDGTSQAFGHPSLRGLVKFPE
jgi:hypothetical protein